MNNETLVTHEKSPSYDQPLLEIEQLCVSAKSAQGRTEIVKGLNLRLGRERLAVVGESGSGKSMTFRSLLGLVPSNIQVEAASIKLMGQRIDHLDAKGLRRLRGSQIGMVVQDPRQGFDPCQTIGAQIVEMLKCHGKGNSANLKAKVHELLADVHIRDPRQVADLYPHQVSGGMAQRAMLAMVLSAEPKLLIADEATSALDAVVRYRILELIDEQVKLRGMGLVLISHDLTLVGRYADRVAVMYAGRVMEELTCDGSVMQPKHPYTQGLMACRPSVRHLHQSLPVLIRDPSWIQ